MKDEIRSYSTHLDGVIVKKVMEGLDYSPNPGPRWGRNDDVYDVVKDCPSTALGDDRANKADSEVYLKIMNCNASSPIEMFSAKKVVLIFNDNRLL
jgi:hypothetical protein